MEKVKFSRVMDVNIAYDAMWSNEKNTNSAFAVTSEKFEINVHPYGPENVNYVKISVEKQEYSSFGKKC